MSQAGILDHVLLVGSWCALFYKDYFIGIEYRPVIRTRDIDFLTSTRPRFSKHVDLEHLLKPFGFDIEFFGEGVMKLESEELMIEFLVPEVGPHRDKPTKLAELNFNAQPMRHMSMLWRDPIDVVVSDIHISLPHPADFCIQKLIASSKRKRDEKAIKDRETALEVFDALIEKGEKNTIHSSINNLSKSEKKIVLSELNKVERNI